MHAGVRGANFKINVLLYFEYLFKFANNPWVISDWTFKIFVILIVYWAEQISVVFII